MLYNDAVNELGAETVLPDEERLFAAILEHAVEMLRREHRPGKPMLRDAHPKHHGVVRGLLTVDADLDPELRAGLFAEPARTYPAWVRFSNGRAFNDKAPDARGMAIKVCDVGGEKLLESERDGRTQDFLFFNHPVFFVKDAADYLDFNAALAANRPLRFHFGLNPLRWRIRELGILRRLLFQKVASPLGIAYFSAVPFAFGPGRAARFCARPRPLEPAPRPPGASNDYLREAMSRHLSERDAEFDFLAQFQTDARRMPVEDPRLHWNSPWRKLATLRIPRQGFESPAQMAFAENLSFTPWHALPAHRPLGAINRARKVVYETISRIRHEHNGAPRAEPSGDERFDAP